MTRLEAVFENGIFRPLEPVQLAENQRVTVTFEENTAADGADQILFSVSGERWQALCEALDAPPKDLPALRKLLTEPSLFDDGRNAAS